MRTAQEKTIGDTTYNVTLLGPGAALDLLADLVKMLGPALAPVFANLDKLGAAGTEEGGALDVELGDTGFLGEAVMALCSNLDPAVTKRAIKTLAAVTTVQVTGGAMARLSDVYEKHFLDRGLGEALTEWLPFALGVQFDDFFALLGNAARRLPRRAPKAAPVQ